MKHYTLWTCLESSSPFSPPTNNNSTLFNIILPTGNFWHEIYYRLALWGQATLLMSPLKGYSIHWIPKQSSPCFPWKLLLSAVFYIAQICFNCILIHTTHTHTSDHISTNAKEYIVSAEAFYSTLIGFNCNWINSSISMAGIYMTLAHLWVGIWLSGRVGLALTQACWEMRELQVAFGIVQIWLVSPISWYSDCCPGSFTMQGYETPRAYLWCWLIQRNGFVPGESLWG